MDNVVTSNEQSLFALKGIEKNYHIVTDSKDNLLACIKLLCVITKSVVAMRAENSNRNALSNLSVVGIINVLQNSSVKPSTDKMKQFHDHIEFKRFDSSSSGISFKTPSVFVGYPHYHREKVINA